MKVDSSWVVNVVIAVACGACVASAHGTMNGLAAFAALLVLMPYHPQRAN